MSSPSASVPLFAPSDDFHAFPRLYKPTKTGFINTWQIFVHDDKFWTEEGKLDGKITRSKETQVVEKNVGKKNYRSAAVQARTEAQAKFKKRIETDKYTDNLAAVTALDHASVARGGYWSPMLAKEFEKERHKIGPTDNIFSQPKLDGVRALGSKDGLHSRAGKPIETMPIINELIIDIATKEQIVFDGELYNEKYKDNFQGLISKVKNLKASQRAPDLQYHVYDIIILGIPDAPFSLRLNRLKMIFSKNKELFKDKFILVDTIALNINDKNAAELHINTLEEHYLAAGYEGQMIRRDTPYTHGRSDGLLKRKRFEDAEFKILDVIEGKGERAGAAGSFYVLDPTDESIKFNTNIKATHDDLREILTKKDQLINTLCTIKYFGKSDNQHPRFPYAIKWDPLK